MGWRERVWYLGDHAKMLFDTNGNAGPTVWVDGRVMHRERIVLGGGSRSWKVLAPPAILLALLGVEVIEGLATEPAPAAV